MMCSCNPLSSDNTSHHDQRAQDYRTPLQGKPAVTQGFGVLESLDSRRGTWRKDATIAPGVWVTVLSAPDAQGKVLVKPRAELDIIRRMNQASLWYDSQPYTINIPPFTALSPTCPVHAIDMSPADIPRSPVTTLPPDLASHYDWLIDHTTVVGTQSRYCARNAIAAPWGLHLQHWHPTLGQEPQPLSDTLSCTASECFGFELESTSSAIVNYYLIREPNETAPLDEAQWLAMPYAQRASILRNLLDTDQHASNQLGTRLTHTPTFLAPTLLRERATIWETTSIMPQPSLEQMLTQMSIVKDLFESRWSLHLHISFPVPSVNSTTINQIRHLVYLINEYLTLKVYAHDIPAVLHEFTGPSMWESTLNTSKSIQDASLGKNYLLEFKYHYIAFRCTDPYGMGRCGFEVRRTVNGITEQLYLLRQLSEFWKHPQSIMLEHDSPLFIPSTDSPDLQTVLSHDIWKIFSKAEPRIAALLIGVNGYQYGFTDTLILDRAMLPLIQWEVRIDEWYKQGRIDASTADALQSRVAQARADYLSRLASLADSIHDVTQPPSQTSHDIAILLHDWAQQTELWKYY